MGAITAFMSVLSAVTPSKKDDKIVTKLDKIGELADRFGFQFKKRK